MRGLIIKQKWAELILANLKTMEIRGSNTHIRGTIGIIKSGTKKVWGTVDLVDCIRLDEKQFYAESNRHKVNTKFNNIPYKNVYGWVLENPIKYSEPVEYEHRQGCIIWVNI